MSQTPSCGDYEYAIDRLLRSVVGELSKTNKGRDAYHLHDTLIADNVGEWKIIVLLALLFSRWGITSITDELVDSLRPDHENMSKLMENRRKDFDRILNGFEASSGKHPVMQQSHGKFGDWELATRKEPLAFLTYHHRLFKAHQGSPSTAVDRIKNEVSRLKENTLTQMCHGINSTPSETDNKEELCALLAESVEAKLRMGNSKLSKQSSRYPRESFSDTADNRVGNPGRRSVETEMRRQITRSRDPSRTASIRPSSSLSEVLSEISRESSDETTWSSEEPLESARRPRREPSKRPGRSRRETSRRLKRNARPSGDVSDDFRTKVLQHRMGGTSAKDAICFGRNDASDRKSQRDLIEMRPGIKSVIKLDTKGTQKSVICTLISTDGEKWFKVAFSAWMRYGDRLQKREVEDFPQTAFVNTKIQPVFLDSGQRAIILHPRGKMTDDGRMVILEVGHATVSGVRARFPSDEAFLKEIDAGDRDNIAKQLERETTPKSRNERRVSDPMEEDGIM